MRSKSIEDMLREHLKNACIGDCDVYSKKKSIYIENWDEIVTYLEAFYTEEKMQALDEFGKAFVAGVRSGDGEIGKEYNELVYLLECVYDTLNYENF